jgi:hypothetical protein
MKKFLITLFLILSGLVGYSQSRMGFSESEIRKEFSESKFEVGYTDSRIKYISTLFDRLYVVYFFNNNNICYMTSATPTDGGMVNFLVENYNKKYVIVDDRNWKSYTENGILYISLVEVQGNLTFVYTAQK